MEDHPAGCAHFEEELSALLDGELESRREEEVRAHVEACRRCRDRFAALGSVNESLRALPAPALPPDLGDRLRRRIAAEESRRPPGRTAPRLPRRWRMLPAAALAAAAAVALYLAVARRPAPLGSAPGEEAAMGEALAALEGASDEEIVLLLELDTIEDFDVIADLELLEGLDELDGNGAG